ncbi:MAG: hypothetical protein AB1716_19050, partial [Planctomycetota bacterium]
MRTRALATWLAVGFISATVLAQTAAPQRQAAAPEPQLAAPAAAAPAAPQVMPAARALAYPQTRTVDLVEDL